MTTQLHLLNTSESSATVPDHRTTGRRNTVPPAIRDQLDDNTRRRGLAGIAAARRQLEEANRRVASRDAQRKAQREADLIEVVNHARTMTLVPGFADDLPRPPATHTSHTDNPDAPDGNAAA